MSYFRQPANPPLTLMQLNAENLFVYLDGTLPLDLNVLGEKGWQALSKASIPNKPLQKIQRLGEMILDVDPDIIGLNEVGGFESIDHFNRYFLKDRYQPFLTEGNSNRGIDIGYLVRRGLPFEFEMVSHKDRPLNFIYPHERRLAKPPRSHLFSRDCVELHLRRHGATTPDLVFLLVHLKSKLDPEGHDPFGNLRREAELKALITIYAESQKRFPNVDHVVLGDFNGIARKDKTDPEFKSLHAETDLINALEYVGLEGEWSTTQVQFDRQGRRYLLQLDYIFVSQGLVPHIDHKRSFVYRYKNDLGIHSQLPTNFDEKLLLPSDHYPVVVRIQS